MTLSCQNIQLNPSNRCRFLASILKDTFLKCHSFPEELPVSSPEAEETAIDFDEEDDQIFVSAIISKYMESKCKKQAQSPESGYFMINARAMLVQANCGETREEYLSAGSRLSRCSSATSFDAFVSVKTRFSRSSSLNKIDFQEFSKRSVIVEFSHCEGWPFSLCRKALLLPPLPKSPPDSWSWRKNTGMVRIHG